MKLPFLVGKKFYLREIRKEDLNETYQQWLNDEDVCAYNSHHRFPNYRENMVSYYKNVIKSNSNLILAIIDKKTDLHIGNVSLQEIDKINRSAEFAIIIGNKKYWGRGVGEEVGKLIISHGFKQLNLQRIYCGTADNNLGMQKLAKKLGFKKEGVSRSGLYKNGQYYDIINYGVLKNEQAS